jgi:hypothetical protein
MSNLKTKQQTKIAVKTFRNKVVALEEELLASEDSNVKCCKRKFRFFSFNTLFF